MQSKHSLLPFLLPLFCTMDSKIIFALRDYFGASVLKKALRTFLTRIKDKSVKNTYPNTVIKVARNWCRSCYECWRGATDLPLQPQQRLTRTERMWATTTLRLLYAHEIVIDFDVWPQEAFLVSKRTPKSKESFYFSFWNSDGQKIRLDKFWEFLSCFSFAFVNAILTHFWSSRTTASESLGETGSQRVARDEIGGLNLDATSATFFTVVNTFGILRGIVIGLGWNWL